MPLCPLNPWLRWSPWLVLLVGVMLGPMFAYSPLLFGLITLVTLLTGVLCDR
jgi:hypothetical protein